MSAMRLAGMQTRPGSSTLAGSEAVIDKSRSVAVTRNSLPSAVKRMFERIDSVVLVGTTAPTAVQFLAQSSLVDDDLHRARLLATLSITWRGSSLPATE